MRSRNAPPNEPVATLLVLHPDGERVKCVLSGVMWPEVSSTNARLSLLTLYLTRCQAHPGKDKTVTSSNTNLISQDVRKASKMYLV